MGVITVSAICFEREDGTVLTVRKRGTHAWMLPGGKPEPGETAAECAVREVLEELGVEIGIAVLEPIDDAAEAPLNRELIFPRLLAERAVER